MDLRLPNNEIVPADLLLRWVLRTDLTPVPASLEFTVRAVDGMAESLAEGAVLQAGQWRFRIVKIERSQPAANPQAGEIVSGLSCTALLDSCHAIGYRQPRAVIRQNSSLGDLYLACGAKIAIDDDIPVNRFACFAGEIPSFHLAQALQEEAGAVVLSGGEDDRLSFRRLSSFAKQAPKLVIAHDPAEQVESQFLERHEVPAFFSAGPDGGIVQGNRTQPRALLFAPRADIRILHNMTRCLVTRRILQLDLSPGLRAGDVVSLGGRPLIVITAAHWAEQSKENQGVTQSSTKLWLGEVH